MTIAKRLRAISTFSRLFAWARFGRQPAPPEPVTWGTWGALDPHLAGLDTQLRAAVDLARETEPTVARPDLRRANVANTVALTRYQQRRLERLAEVEGTSVDALVQMIVEQALSQRRLLVGMAEGIAVDRQQPRGDAPEREEAADFYIEKLRAAG